MGGWGTDKRPTLFGRFTRAHPLAYRPSRRRSTTSRSATARRTSENAAVRPRTDSGGASSWSRTTVGVPSNDSAPGRYTPRTAGRTGTAKPVWPAPTVCPCVRRRVIALSLPSSAAARVCARARDNAFSASPSGFANFPTHPVGDYAGGRQNSKVPATLFKNISYGRGNVLIYGNIYGISIFRRLSISVRLPVLFSL